MKNERLEGIFTDILELDEQIDPQKSREEYKTWDSLANMNLMMAINGEFGSVLELDDLEKFTSYEAINALVSSRT